MIAQWFEAFDAIELMENANGLPLRRESSRRHRISRMSRPAQWVIACSIVDAPHAIANQSRHLMSEPCQRRLIATILGSMPAPAKYVVRTSPLAIADGAMLMMSRWWSRSWRPAASCLPMLAFVRGSIDRRWRALRNGDASPSRMDRASNYLRQ